MKIFSLVVIAVLALASQAQAAVGVCAGRVNVGVGQFRQQQVVVPQQVQCNSVGCVAVQPQFQQQVQFVEVPNLQFVQVQPQFQAQHQFQRVVTVQKVQAQPQRQGLIQRLQERRNQPQRQQQVVIERQVIRNH